MIPYIDDDHAVDIANSTIYGLSGAVAGPSEHASSIALHLRAGQVDINGGELNFLAPFGGQKQSGIGREMGRYGLQEFLEVKASPAEFPRLCDAPPFGVPGGARTFGHADSVLGGGIRPEAGACIRAWQGHSPRIVRPESLPRGRHRASNYGC
ncbi:aldehyde dehydrogenase family protein [Streptomyces sp. NPDC001514]